MNSSGGICLIKHDMTTLLSQIRREIFCDLCRTPHDSLLALYSGFDSFSVPWQHNLELIQTLWHVDALETSVSLQAVYS